MPTAIERNVSELSAGTIASISTARGYAEIDLLRDKLLQSTARWVETGVLKPDDPWQKAWNLFKVGLDFYTDTQRAQWDLRR